MKMQKVSLWVGDFDNKEVLDDYIEGKYLDLGFDNWDIDAIMSDIENGTNTYQSDYVESIFNQKFSTDDHDQDFREVEFLGEKQKSLKVLLEGCSYDDQIIPNFIEIIDGAENIEGNTVVLLYDYEYTGEKLGDNGEGYSLKYIGCVDFDATVDLSWMDR